MNCEDCSLKELCTNVNNGLTNIQVGERACDLCKYSKEGFYNEPCVYCNVYAMDGHCKFERGEIGEA